MKTGIHPEYKETTVHCSCGENFTTHSTVDKISVEICSKCHPFYTGQQKFVDTGGRVERFNKKFAKHTQQQQATEEQDKTAESEQATSE